MSLEIPIAGECRAGAENNSRNRGQDDATHDFSPGGRLAA